MVFILLALIGFVGGIASGLLGVGGGLIFGPLLMALFGFNPHVAIGTSIALVVPTAMVGAWQHIQTGNVQWKIVLVMLIFALLGAWLGAKASIHMDPQILKRFYAAFLILVALRIFFSK